jgi:hypothetical protein
VDACGQTEAGGREQGTGLVQNQVLTLWVVSAWVMGVVRLPRQGQLEAQGAVQISGRSYGPEPPHPVPERQQLPSPLRLQPHQPSLRADRGSDGGHHRADHSILQPIVRSTLEQE